MKVKTIRSFLVVAWSTSCIAFLNHSDIKSEKLLKFNQSFENAETPENSETGLESAEMLSPEINETYPKVSHISLPEHNESDLKVTIISSPDNKRPELSKWNLTNEAKPLKITILKRTDSLSQDNATTPPEGHLSGESKSPENHTSKDISEPLNGLNVTKLTKLGNTTINTTKLTPETQKSYSPDLFKITRGSQKPGHKAKLLAVYTRTSKTILTTITKHVLTTCYSLSTFILAGGTTTTAGPCNGRRRKRFVKMDIDNTDYYDLDPSSVNLEDSMDAEVTSNKKRTGLKLTFWSRSYSTLTVTTKTFIPGTTIVVSLKCTIPGLLDAASCGFYDFE